MRLRTLLLVAGLLALIFGAGFLFIPQTLLPLYGLQSDPDTKIISRFFGVALVNLGAALAELGKRVCLIDLHPQAHLTINSGVDPSPDV